ncbi:uncharacterized protein LOC141855609 [Brevipalpus obovatus]|uniref:uncharacterized protein LOC141855609 n=1 Tax=Brevipalpus obovatus TaxID=246614 RepID=UPI003D9E10F2
MEYHSQYHNQPQSSSSLMLNSSTNTSCSSSDSTNTTTRQRWQPKVKSSHNVAPSSTKVSSSMILSPSPSSSPQLRSKCVSTSCCPNTRLPLSCVIRKTSRTSKSRGTIFSELLSPKLMLVSIVLLLAIVIPAIRADHCPSMCECLWRNGKQTAECGGQGLMSIPSGVSPSSQVLNLSRNNFQTLPHKVFQERGLINLQKIYLSECKLGMIAADAFIQLTNLIELDLSSNLLTSVPSESLQQTTALRRLNLKRNPIQVIHEDSLAQLAHLRFLDLSDCQVESIDVNAFKGLKTLEQLKLDGNRLSTLPAGIFESVPLTSIGLHRNPWRCDCELRSTIEWLYKARLVPNLWPTCSTPIKLNGAMWNSMGLDSYACPPVFKVRETEMKAPLGTNLSLVCIIKSTPKAKVFWSYAEIGDSNKNSTTSDIFGGPKYTISDDTNSGSDQIISTLTIHSLDYDDSRRNYICSAENSAAMTSKNFTISLYSSPISAISSWTKVEIAGTITVFLLVFVIGIVLIAVCLLRYRKDGRDSNGGNNLNSKESKNGLPSIDVLKSIKSIGRSIHSSPEHKVINDASLKASKTDIGSSSGYGSNGVTPDLTSNVIKSMDNYQPMCPPIDFYPGLLQVTNSMCKTDSCEMIVPNDQHHHQTLHHHHSGALNGHLQQSQQQQQQHHLMSPLDGRQNRSPVTFNNYENYDAYTAYHHGNYNQLNFRDSLGYGHFDAPHYYTSTSQPPTSSNSYTTNATTPNGDVDLGDSGLRGGGGGGGTVNVLDEVGIGNCGPNPMVNCIEKRDSNNIMSNNMPTTSQSSDVRLTSVSPLHPPIHEANLINLHHVNVLGQGSYCNISHPTIVRYSPDEGYAEEQANPSFVLEGTEV